MQALCMDYLAKNVYLLLVNVLPTTLSMISCLCLTKAGNQNMDPTIISLSILWQLTVAWLLPVVSLLLLVIYDAPRNFEFQVCLLLFVFKNFLGPASCTSTLKYQGARFLTQDCSLLVKKMPWTLRWTRLREYLLHPGLLTFCDSWLKPQIVASAMTGGLVSRASVWFLGLPKLEH